MTMRNSVALLVLVAASAATAACHRDERTSTTSTTSAEIVLPSADTPVIVGAPSQEQAQPVQETNMPRQVIEIQPQVVIVPVVRGNANAPLQTEVADPTGGTSATSGATTTSTSTSSSATLTNGAQSPSATAAPTYSSFPETSFAPSSPASTSGFTESSFAPPANPPSEAPRSFPESSFSAQ